MRDNGMGFASDYNNKNGNPFAQHGEATVFCLQKVFLAFRFFLTTSKYFRQRFQARDVIVEFVKTG